jgi:MinD superfamily P-loop ATPase
MQRALEIVKKFGAKTYVIINKYDLNREMSLQIESWCNSEDVSVIGHLPFDPEMVKAMIQGKSINEFNDKSEISRKIKEIWYNINNINQL